MRRLIIVLLTSALAALFLGAMVPASATAPPASGYAHDATPAYDGAVHSVQAHTSEETAIALLDVPEGAGWTVATVAGHFSVLSPLSVAANSGSRLAGMSDSAFSAADNVGDWTVSAKHLPNAGGNYSKWAPGVDINGAVGDALRSEGATFWPNPGGTADSFIVRTQMDAAVGTKGQTVVKVVVADDGHVITAYPGNWP